jgi:hypothetical protein
LRRIVLLYNDRNRPQVSEIRERLNAELAQHDFITWMAFEDMNMSGDLFQQIEGAIKSSAGAIFFLGEEGMGRFQRNIEEGAVKTQIWLKGAAFGRLVVHLVPKADIPESMWHWPTVNHDGTEQTVEKMTARIVQRLTAPGPEQSTSSTSAAAPPAAVASQISVSDPGPAEPVETIVLFSDAKSTQQAGCVGAELRQILDLKQYQVWHRGVDESAYGDVPTQIQNRIGSALAVVVVIGSEGDGGITGPAMSLIWKRIEDARGRTNFGNLVVRLPDAAEPTSFLSTWTTIKAPSPLDFRVLAEGVAQKLQIPTRFSAALQIDEAVNRLPQGPDRTTVVDQFRQTAQLVSDGKPITLMLGPYASADGEDDHSCPSYTRQRLMELITDPQLRKILLPENEDPPIPMLWQDHLATICLLSGSSRDEVIEVIAQSVREAAGGATGKPGSLFKSIAAFATQIQGRGAKNMSVGVPRLTIISVCPGLRMERALIAAGCAFDRVSLMSGTDKGPDLHRAAYYPNEEHIQRAASGAELFMPDRSDPKPADQPDFIRIIKPFGSWDLEPGVPSGDLGQAYDALSQLKAKFDRLVSAAGSGAYIVLGGGLGTPPVQAVHALLLRDLLEQPERRPLLALASATTSSRDPLRKLETTRIKNVGWPKRLKILSSEPIRFIDALTVAFGGQPPALAASATAAE